MKGSISEFELGVIRARTAGRCPGEAETIFHTSGSQKVGRWK
jgi:hypothetical protein